MEKEKPGCFTVTANYETLTFAELVVKAATIAEVLNPPGNAQPTHLEMKLGRFWLEVVGFELRKRSPATTEEAHQRARILLFIETMQADISREKAGLTTTADSSTDSPVYHPTSKGIHPDLPAGLHLVTPRTLYEHHGLSLGDGWVIHRTGPGDAITDGTVCVVTLEDFADGRPWHVQPHRSRRYSPSESVERGRSKEGEVAYNVALNNCEHFVNWCIEGEHRSEQVEQVLSSAKVLAQTTLHHVTSPSPTPVRVPTSFRPTVTTPPVVPHMLEKAGDSLLPSVLHNVTKALPPVVFVSGAVEAATRLFDALFGD